MADTRIPSILPPPRSEPPLRDGALSVRIVTLPERIYDIRKAAQVRAEVVRSEEDGMVRLASAEGEITVKTDRPEQFTPGARVEVRIPPGRPPTSAEVRPAPPEKNTPRGGATDVDVQVSRPVPRPDSPAAPDFAGRIVKAVPISLAQALHSFEAASNTVISSSASPAFSAPALPPEIFFAEGGAQALKNFILLNTALLQGSLLQNLPALSALPGSFSSALPGAPFLSEGAPVLPRGTEIGRILKGVLGLAPNGLQFSPLPDSPAPADIPANLSSAPASFLQVQGIAPFSANGDPFFPVAPFSADLFTARDSGFPFPPPDLRAGESAAAVIGALPQKDVLTVAVVFPPLGEDAVGRFYALLESAGAAPSGAIVTLSPIVERAAGSALHAPSPVSFAPFSAEALSALPLGFPYFLAAESWPVLQEAVRVLAQVSPPAAQAFSNMIPNPATPHQMAPAALFFIAAMRAGDVEGWLGGRAVDALRRAGRPDILGRLSQESSMLSRLGTEPLGQEWKGTSLPLFWQGEIYKVPVYYKRSDEERGTGEDDGKGMVRFIINLDLSRMGKMQMDALYREGARRFDLILRSSQTFTKAAEHEMRGIFSGALEDIGLRGEMGFQCGAEKWVTVQPDKLYEFSQNF